MFTLCVVKTSSYSRRDKRILLWLTFLLQKPIISCFLYKRLGTFIELIIILFPGPYKISSPSYLSETSIYFKLRPEQIFCSFWGKNMYTLHPFLVRSFSLLNDVRYHKKLSHLKIRRNKNVKNWLMELFYSFFNQNWVGRKKNSLKILAPTVNQTN